MFYLRLAGRRGNAGSRQRIRRTVTKRFARSLAYIRLEDRLMMAGLLGGAEGFAVLGASTVTNTGPTVIMGNLGVSPGSAITGFPPGIVASGTIHAADADAAQAQSDVTIAYNDLAGRASNFNLTGQDLGGLTLTPGVYTFASSAQLTGTLTLDAQGDPNAEFIFQIGSTITTASNSFVILINAADACDVYWQVGSSATLGTNTAFQGNILALTSITLTTNATILNGRALAQNGAVTMDSNQVSIDGCGSIAWEKRATDANPVLLGGATFQITPNPLTGVGTLMVVDGGVNDADALANGVLQVDEVLMGTYTITESVAPPGYALDDDTTRLVTVNGDNFHAVIGVQGVDDVGNTNESDFHNTLSLGSAAWEKRDNLNALQCGATFTISPDPTDGVGDLTIVDNGSGDADPDAGQILVNDVPAGSYTITETVSPPGYAVDDDPTRTVTVTAGDLTQIIGVQGVDDPGDTDESDFHNRLGSISWEKRATDANAVLLGGATFEISPNPLTGGGTLIVVDGGANDADGLANGVLQVDNVLLGTYTITETAAPAGYALDDDATRSITVSAGDLNAVVGAQGNNEAGDTDESDFHNRLGSISWEKRATDANPVLLAGATFEISPNPLTGGGTLIVVDGGANDADGLANGVLQVDNVLLGTYTITETAAPAGYALDDDANRSVAVSASDLNAVVGVQGVNNVGDTDESDFHNRLGGVSGLKFNDLDRDGVFDVGEPGLLGWTIYVDYNNDGVLQSGVEPSAETNAVGTYTVNGVMLGAWSVREVGQSGWTNSFPATSDVFGRYQPIVVTSAVFLSGIDFGNFQPAAGPGGLIVIGAGKSPMTPQLVRVIDSTTGAVLTQFAPYGNTFQGGIRVATGDLTGDGVDEIVTAPGWGIVGEVRVYTLGGVLLTSFLPYGPTFNGGVQVAIGDVDGDGVNDTITVPSFGPSEVRVFRNVLVASMPAFNATSPFRDFLAFPASFIGGAVVGAADMGSTAVVGGPFNNMALDQKAEIIVGSGAGLLTTVKVFDVSLLAMPTPTSIPPVAGSFIPFTANYKGGVSVSLARVNPDDVPDIVVGAGVNGRSLVDVWAWSNTTNGALSSLSANGIGFNAFTDPSWNSSIDVAAQDNDGDDIADSIFVVQGPGGTTNQIRAFDILSSTPLQVSAPAGVPGIFPGPYDIDTIEIPSLVAPGNPEFASRGDYDVDGDADGADFLAWQQSFGASLPVFYGADGSGDGMVDTADYGVWASNFGQTLPRSAGSEANAAAAFDERLTHAMEIDNAHATMRGFRTAYDRHAFPMGTVLTRFTRTGAARGVFDSVTAIDRSRNARVLATMGLITARPGSDLVDDLIAHKAPIEQFETQAVDVLFGTLGGGGGMGTWISPRLSTTEPPGQRLPHEEACRRRCPIGRRSAKLRS